MPEAERKAGMTTNAKKQAHWRARQRAGIAVLEDVTWAGLARRMGLTVAELDEALEERGEPRDPPLS
jgi:hypothetical protein